MASDPRLRRLLSPGFLAVGFRETVGQEEAAEIWDENYQELWESQLWEWGYAVLGDVDDGTRRINLICEGRWRAVENSGSPLWDQPTMFWGVRNDKKKRALVRSQMPFRLSIWRARRKVQKNADL